MAGLLGLILLAGCTSTQDIASVDKGTVKNTAPLAPRKQVYTYTAADRECLKRAMYFESKRSSRDGLMAVGSVVMNRLTSGAYADTICGVVGQKRQFAPGVLSRPVNDTAAPELNEAADAILRGERNQQVKEAMFFHTDGLRFPYDNMHYVTVAGGNKFYEKRDDDGELQTPPPKSPNEYILAYAPHMADQNSLIAANDLGNASQMTQTAYTVPQAETSVTPLEAPVPMQKPQIQVASAAPMAQQPVGMPVQQLVMSSQQPGTQPAQARQGRLPQVAQQQQPQAQQPQSLAMSLYSAPQAQAYVASQANAFPVPGAVPLPAQRPQISGVARVQQAGMAAAPEVWSLRPAK
ncbi:cell wall hydrolase [Rhizobium sp. XQZ8]|uniref:cell wall hydrolase n=1 Tax=Rhizobium populisoli TaxID=2859785 RepID=UPI001CA50B2B|nr:cell wall hydrolase [Rhizobium populisoli]MBW6423874.1 cell wall hydrolase [Rhizobium populisoli]